MTARTIRLVTAGLAVTSGILAVGDKITSMPGVPGWLTSAWPVVLAFSTIFDRIGHVLIAPATPPADPHVSAPLHP